MDNVTAQFICDHSIAKGTNTYAIFVDGKRHSERGYGSTRIATSENEAVEIFKLTHEG